MENNYKFEIKLNMYADAIDMGIIHDETVSKTHELNIDEIEELIYELIKWKMVLSKDTVKPNRTSIKDNLIKLW